VGGWQEEFQFQSELFHDGCDAELEVLPDAAELTKHVQFTSVEGMKRIVNRDLRAYGFMVKVVGIRTCTRWRPRGCSFGTCLRADTHRQAALIKQVYEADPIRCCKCGSVMKIIALIEPPQTEVIEKTLRHCGLWEERAARAPPSAEISITA
jgi:hypothetical protein